jgi:regulatory protein
MKISKLEQQKNRPNRCNVYVDEEFFVGINSNLLVDLDLFVGKEIEKSELNKLLEKEELNKATNKVFDYFSRRLHSKKEIIQKLHGKFSNKIIGDVINKFEDLGYIDDEKFAKAWVESRKRNKGKYVLGQELKTKGIDAEIIKMVLLEETDEESEKERAKNLVIAKRWPEMTRDQRFQKIGSFLARKGFSYDIIKKVISETNE